jgi:hypothetical protein
MNWLKIARNRLAIALLYLLCSTIALEAKNCCPSSNGTACQEEIDQEAYERGLDDEANGYPYYSYVRSKKRYSYNLGRKQMRDELASESTQRPVKISPYVCRFYAKRVSASQLYDHGPMYNQTYGDLR